MSNPETQETPSIESQDFYELMQAYRHCPIVPPNGPYLAYQAVIAFANAYAEKRVQEAQTTDRRETEEGEDKQQRQPHPMIMQLMVPSDVLAAIIGSEPLQRTAATQKIWEYIKKHGLQDQTSRLMINPDEKLRGVLGGKTQVSMFEMTKMISDHLVPNK